MNLPAGTCTIQKWMFVLTAVGSFTTAWPGRPQINGHTLKKLTEFDLPGPTGKRFDYLTIDNDDQEENGKPVACMVVYESTAAP
jgi:hypothetical protein